MNIDVEIADLQKHLQIELKVLQVLTGSCDGSRCLSTE